MHMTLDAHDTRPPPVLTLLSASHRVLLCRSSLKTSDQFNLYDSLLNPNSEKSKKYKGSGKALDFFIPHFHEWGQCLNPHCVHARPKKIPSEIPLLLLLDLLTL